MANSATGAVRLGTTQVVAYTGTAGTTSTAVSAGTNKVRVVLTTDGYIVIGKTPTATTSGVFMAAGIPEIFTINPGEKVSAVQLSGAGNLSVTEVS